MIYKNFDDHITRKHGIVIEGWPLRLFDNPSAIGSQVELNVLLNAWQTGATQFCRMTADEHMAWVESCAKSEPPSTHAVGFPPHETSTVPPAGIPAMPPSQPQNEETSLTLPTNPPAFHTLSFSVISLESAATPQTSSNPSKRPRKTQSDKGKPRKKPSQIQGTNTFQTIKQ